MGQVEIPPIGERVRAERLRRKISLRALARQAGVSASLVSQIETGRIRPSVSTLYAVTGALGMSVTDLLEGPPAAGAAGSEGDRAAVSADDLAGSSAQASPMATAGLAAMLARNPVTAREVPDGIGLSRRNDTTSTVTTSGEREVITLDSGVVWEVMGRLPGERVDFLRIAYQPGSASSSGELMRHPGTEYGFLESGALIVQLGDEERLLTPGDAVSFRSSTPHRYRNEGDTPAVGIWVVIDER